MLLVVGVLAIVYLSRSRGVAAPEGQEKWQQDALLQLLLASQAPALREYLKQTPNPSNPDNATSEAMIERIAEIVLPKPTGEPVPPTLNDIVLALALLESRIGDLTVTANRIEEQSITKDRMVWSILGILGAVIGILGGVLALAAAAVGFMSPT